MDQTYPYFAILVHIQERVCHTVADSRVVWNIFDVVIHIFFKSWSITSSYSICTSNHIFYLSDVFSWFLHCYSGFGEIYIILVIYFGYYYIYMVGMCSIILTFSFGIIIPFNLNMGDSLTYNGLPPKHFHFLWFSILGDGWRMVKSSKVGYLFLSHVHGCNLSRHWASKAITTEDT